jgi:hypothetical protein
VLRKDPRIASRTAESSPLPIQLVPCRRTAEPPPIQGNRWKRARWPPYAPLRSDYVADHRSPNQPGRKVRHLSFSVSRRRTTSEPGLVTKGTGRRTAIAGPRIPAAVFVRFTQRASLSPRTSEKRSVVATRTAEVPEAEIRLEPARQARPMTRPAETTRTQRRAARKPLRGTTHRGAIFASSAPRSRPCARDTHR